MLYVSEDCFDEPFSAQRALSRNRCIHAMGEKVLVAQCSYQQGGTWDGTVKNLRFSWSSVFCLDDHSPASELLNQMGANLISVDETSLILTLLPRSEGKFCRDGLHVNKLRYHCDGFTERYLGGGMVVVAYNPEDVTSVWLFENGIYTEFALIESRFQNKSLSEVETLQKGQNLLIKASEKDNLQAQIRLAHHIGAIADCTDHSRDVRLKEIRSTRTREQNKQHHDYMREETFHD
jgi:hypothetical protein